MVSLVSANRGEGKTTFLRAYAARVVDGGRSVGGVACPAVFENDRRIGYDLIDLRSGNRRLLARVVNSPETEPTVGMYRFDATAVAEGCAAIITAVRNGLDVIAIDEVGPLEFRGGGWADALEPALREHRDEQELIVVVRPSLLDELPIRFPSPWWAVARCIRPPWPVSMQMGGPPL
ncbi:MAG: DUF2478 domain-containing protein [Phycisphaerae bacterium]|nr:DUF2478 domain-containing protein [Phycisphaerae bacterium]